MDEMNEKNPADEGEGELEVKSATERDPAGSQHVTRRGTSAEHVHGGAPSLQHRKALRRCAGSLSLCRCARSCLQIPLAPCDAAVTRLRDASSSSPESTTRSGCRTTDNRATSHPAGCRWGSGRLCAIIEPGAPRPTNRKRFPVRALQSEVSAPCTHTRTWLHAHAGCRRSLRSARRGRDPSRRDHPRFQRRCVPGVWPVQQSSSRRADCALCAQDSP